MNKKPYIQFEILGITFSTQKYLKTVKNEFWESFRRERILRFASLTIWIRVDRKIENPLTTKGEL